MVKLWQVSEMCIFDMYRVFCMAQVFGRACHKPISGIWHAVYTCSC